VPRSYPTTSGYDNVNVTKTGFFTQVNTSKIATVKEDITYIMLFTLAHIDISAKQCCFPCATDCIWYVTVNMCIYYVTVMCSL